MLPSPLENSPKANTQLQVSQGAVGGEVSTEDRGAAAAAAVPGSATARRRRRPLPLIQVQHASEARNSSVLSAAGAPCHLSANQQQQKHREQPEQKHKLHPVAQFALGSGGGLAFHRLPSPTPRTSRPELAFARKSEELIEPKRRFFLGGLLLELHLPGTTLQQLHSVAHGSLTEFLRSLHGDLSTAARVEPRQVTILGITGRYRRVNPDATENSVPMPQHANEEVMVTFEVEPSEDGSPGFDQVVLTRTMQLALRSQQGASAGALGSIMQNATITQSKAAGIAEIPLQERKADAATKVSAIFVPIGVSAAFSGFLIWLAAW